MNVIIGALMLFGLAAFVGSAAHDNYRIGKMQLVMNGISPAFDRTEDSMFFWGATAINVGLTAVCAIGGLIRLAGLAIR